MSLIERFNECNSDGWITAGNDVQFKVINRVLYFQPSNGASDWRYNFMASEDVYKDSSIEFVGHKGFNELWESVRHYIEILEFDHIVGYSQGGALAIRAHENYFHRKGIEPIQTWVFGCPPSIKRPSNELRARFSRVMNIHNRNDIVHILPRLIGYSHVGQNFTLPIIGTKKPSDVSWPVWLSGHSPSQYRQALGLFA